MAVRIGVAGAGALGFHHARLLRELAGDAFVGIYDADPARATHVAEQLGVVAVPSLAALVDAAEAVSIAVPTAFHAETATAVLGAGRHAFIEKPVTVTVADADALAVLAATNGAVVQVGHVERYNRAIRAARPVVRDAWYLEAERLAPYTPRGADVSVVLDLMIHDIDLACWLLGAEPTAVAAIGGAWLKPTPDLAQARLTFAAGQVANLTTMRLADGRRRTLTVVQRNGLVRCDLATGTAEWWRLRDDVDPATLALAPQEAGAFAERMPLEAPEGETLRLEFLDWLAAIRGERPVAVSLAEGRTALAVARQVEAAIADGIARRGA
ncbi:MAG: Gfo/Idh/MocA family oxidoreductase [Gemmatimonadaceae bacterium]|nr:Gfo/Idh/MocA family oxidoreductase [Gemmatimonadaceae bacterium]